jgi:hypothetical protein
VANVMTQRCDGCQELRINDSNHWIMAWLNGSRGMRIVVAAMDADTLQERGDNSKHFCGEACATRWFQNELVKLRQVVTT